MTSLQQRLTKKIQAVCPELLELSLGCEIEIINEQKEWARFVTLLFINRKNGLYYFIESDGSVFHIRGLSKKYKILGHPIQLHHVLKAFMESSKIYPSKSVEIIGYFIVDLWNHNKPLFDQSLDVQEWIDKQL